MDLLEHTAIRHLPPSLREAIVVGAWRRIGRKPLLAYLPSFITFVIAWQTSDSLHMGGLIRTLNIAAWIATFFLVGIGAAASTVLQTRGLRCELRARNIRPAVCLRCGYDLRGGKSATCPECGVALVREAASEAETPQN